jgi:hypothetical protein
MLVSMPAKVISCVAFGFRQAMLKWRMIACQGKAIAGYHMRALAS